MKLAITRVVSVAAIAVLMVAVGSTAAWAQTPCPSSPNYSPDFSSNQSCLTPNDNASPFPILFDGNNVLQLTSSTSNQIGAAWYNTPQPLENGFTTSFQFQFTGASTPPADGIAFVIQNSTSKLNAIGFTGGNGGAIGYGDDDNNLNPSTGEGIPNSLAIEFDTYQNGWDPASNGNGSDSHVAIQSCGSGPNTSH
ncbi:MAG: L-type lectin-domain containing protein, partial [Candidatus Sulfotelmatobacter sp.]